MLGKESFHDTSLNAERIYMGECVHWWSDDASAVRVCCGVCAGARNCAALTPAKLAGPPFFNLKRFGSHLSHVSQVVTGVAAPLHSQATGACSSRVPALRDLR